MLLDRERCIQCARCTRFSSEVSGDTEIAFAGRGDLIEVATSPTVPFDSTFSGNTVQICPVGALTAKPYRFTARPWDLEQVESACTTCAVQCRVAVQSSGERLTRLIGVDSEAVNHGWLCDKGRFTIDAVDGHEGAIDLTNPATRVREPMIRVKGVLQPTTWGEALAAAADLLMDASRTAGGVGAIGGAALTNEGAFAWERFVRGVLASEHVDAQYGDGLDAALLQALPRATIAEAATAKVVVTLTGDLREELPILFLRLRENIVRRGAALIEFAFGPSALRPLARVSMSVRPGEAHLVAEVLTRTNLHLQKGSGVTDEDLKAARELLGESGDGAVIVLGRPNVAEDAAVIERAARLLSERFPAATFLPALRRSNVQGALDMGLAPGLAPGRGFVGDADGRGTLEQLAALRASEQRAVLVLGDLLGNVLDVEGASAALDAAESVVLVTGHGGPTLAFADVVLPAAVQHERLGTVTNIEGRVTAVTPKVTAPGSAWSDVAIAAELADQCGSNLGLISVEQAAKVLEETTGYPALSVLNNVTSDGPVVGRPRDDVERRALDPMAFPGIQALNTVGLAELSGALVEATPARSPSPAHASLEEIDTGRAVEVPHYDAYGVALNVSRRLYDHGVAVQGSPALANLVARATAYLNHAELDRLGLKSGDPVLVHGPKGPLRLPVMLSDETPRGTLEVVFGALDESDDDAPVRALFDPGSVITQVKLATT